MAAAQEKAAAAKKAAQEKAYALHKAAMAAAEKKALEAKKAAQEKAEAERKAAREKAEADRIALEQKHEFDRKAAIITAREKAEAARKAADAAVKAELAEKKRAEQIKHSENKSGNHSSSDEETGSPVKNKVSKTGNLSSDKPHADKVTDLSDDDNNAVRQQNNKSVSTAQPAAEKGTTGTAHIHHPAEGKQSESGDYKAYESKQYGRYINVNKTAWRLSKPRSKLPIKKKPCCLWTAPITFLTKSLSTVIPPALKASSVPAWAKPKSTLTKLKSAYSIPIPTTMMLGLLQAFW